MTHTQIGRFSMENTKKSKKLNEIIWNVCVLFFSGTQCQIFVFNSKIHCHSPNSIGPDQMNWTTIQVWNDLSLFIYRKVERNGRHNEIRRKYGMYESTFCHLVCQQSLNYLFINSLTLCRSDIVMGQSNTVLDVGHPSCLCLRCMFSKMSFS